MNTHVLTDSNIIFQHPLLEEIANYEKTELPLIEPKDVKFVKKIQVIIFSLIHLKIGRANYLKRCGISKGVYYNPGSFHRQEEMELRKEAESLLTLLTHEVSSFEITRALFSGHEIPTGTYGLSGLHSHHY